MTKNQKLTKTNILYLLTYGIITLTRLSIVLFAMGPLTNNKELHDSVETGM
jgi:hypothetical protein